MTVSLDDEIVELRRANAELRQRLDEGLVREAATAEVLQVINASPGDLAPVFEAILEKARIVCAAAHGGLWTYDGNFVHLAATHGEPGFAAWLRKQGPVQVWPGAPTERLARGEDYVQFDDVTQDRSFERVPAFLEQLKIAGIRTTLFVPLRKEGALLGVVAVYRQKVRPFSEEQVALLQNFAAQAAIAMENARLIAETGEALEQQTATAEVLQVINSSPGNLGPVFDAVLEKAHSLCGVAFGALELYDGGKLRAVALRGLSDPLAALLHQPHEPTPGSPLSLLLGGERIVQITDMAELAKQHPDDLRAQAGAEYGLRTVLFVPLRKDGVLLGHITAGRLDEVRLFSDKQIALLQNFAAQAVIAMENARLLTETREALEQQTATAEVLGVINASPGDLAPVFDTMLDKALDLCGAAFGNLWTCEGGLFHAKALRRVPQPYADHLLRTPVPATAKGTVLAQLLAGSVSAQVADAASDEAYTKTAARRLVELGGGRTVAGVALRRDEELLGAITIYRQEVRLFTNKQIALLQNFAQQAVIAMENARLLGELRQRTNEVAELNRGLENRVAEQVEELGRVGRLKRFLAPQLAELIVSQGDEKILESHRREIVVVFCDLRGYTAFTETAGPEEVLVFLREYHGALGPLVSQFEGTLDQFSGDGIMVFFNDPVPCPDPAERAVKMAMAMREEAGKLIAVWRRDGCELGFGAGVAQGYATLGQIGFSERSGYTAIGTVCNLAARLCAEAKDGQILVSSRVARAVQAIARLEDLGNLELKGLRRAVAAFNVVQSTSPAPRSA